MSLLKQYSILNNSILKDKDQSLNTSCSKLEINRSSSVSYLNVADRLQEQQDSSISIQSLKKKLSVATLDNSLKLHRNNNDNPAALKELSNKTASFLGRQAPLNQNRDHTGLKTLLQNAKSDESLVCKQRMANSNTSQLDSANEIDLSSHNLRDKISIRDQSLNSSILNSTNANSLGHSRTISLTDTSQLNNNRYYFGQTIGGPQNHPEKETRRAFVTATKGSVSSLRANFKGDENLKNDLSNSKVYARPFDTSNRGGEALAHGSLLDNQRSEQSYRKAFLTNDKTQSPHHLQRHFLAPNSEAEFQTSLVSLQYNSLIQPTPRSNERADFFLDKSLSLAEELNRKRTEMQAKMNNKSSINSLSSSNHFGGDKVLRADNRIEELFNVSPDRLRDNFLNQDRQKRAFAEIASGGRLHELQNILTDASDKEFDQLPPSYMEALIKLSSTIVTRVKNSNYYNAKY